MNPETITIILQFVVSPLIAGVVLWLVYLTKHVSSNTNKLGINTALDKQTQSTLTEIKNDIADMRNDISKILFKMNGGK